MSKAAHLHHERAKDMEHEQKPLDQRAREAEQYAFDFGQTPQPQPQPKDYEQPKTCNQAGYCYCPRCNPR